MIAQTMQIVRLQTITEIIIQIRQLSFDIIRSLKILIGTTNRY
jgi:hypothetical protein